MDKLSGEIESSEFILDLDFSNSEKKSSCLIPFQSSLTYQLDLYNDKFIKLMKSNFKEKYGGKLELDQSFTVKTLNGFLRLYDDGSNDIQSFVIGKLKSGQEVITEFLFKLMSIHVFKPENTELKSIKSFILKEVPQKEYPDYNLVLSIIWGHFEKPQMIYNGVELLRVRRSALLEGFFYKYVYSIDFQPLTQASSTYNFIFGLTSENQIQLLKTICTISNYNVPSMKK